MSDLNHHTTHDNNHDNNHQQDLHWMQQAIHLSSQAIYSTKPNPNVGCVLVKDGHLIGSGFHPKAGQPHAEVFALREAGMQAQGATAYVTLEPCAHYGKTPPCAEALVKAQVARVVIACDDPNPLVAGKGVTILQNAGILVTRQVMTDVAAQYNLGFLKAMRTGMPFVRAKVAASLDGRTAMASGESKWITGNAARADVQHWRAISAAVITGIQTVLADDCLLNVRDLANVDLASVVQPKRVILDRQGQLPLTAKILDNPETVMVMGPYREDLAQLGVVQLPVQNLAALLQCLCKQYQIYDVLIEAGATLTSAFLSAGLVDELIHYTAATLLGRTARPMYNLDLQSMSQQQRFKLLETQQLGDDIRLRLMPILPERAPS